MIDNNPTPFPGYESPIVDVGNLCLMDDIVLRVVLDNNPTMAKVIISPVLERDDFEVKSAKTQTEVSSIYGHSVVFDCLIEFADGTIVDVELLKAKSDIPLERMAYNRAMLVTRFGLNKGDSYGKLRHSIVIVLLDGDYFGKGEPLYHINYCLKRQSEYSEVEPGQGIYIANTRDKDLKTALGQLMADITATDPGKIKDPVLSESLEMVKSKRGKEIMGTYYYELMKKYKAEFEAKMRAYLEAEMKAELEAKMRAEAIAEGKAEGRTMGSKATLVSLYRKNLIRAEDAANELSITVEEFLKLAEEIGA